MEGHSNQMPQMDFSLQEVCASLIHGSISAIESRTLNASPLGR